jgi:hypothetical protein
MVRQVETRPEVLNLKSHKRLNRIGGFAEEYSGFFGLGICANPDLRRLRGEHEA